MNDSLTAKVRSVVAGHFRVDADRLTDEARIRDDLGADWLDRLELMIAIEDQVASIEITNQSGDILGLEERADKGGIPSDLEQLFVDAIM